MITPLAWAVTIAAIAALLVFDLLVSGRRRQAPGFGAAVGWSAFYVGIALLFGVVLVLFGGWELGTEYFAGYAVEKTLSIDNLFVFVIIIGAFAVPEDQQRRVLTWGILIALVLRGIFIAIGGALLQTFSVMLLVFGLLLVVTAVQLLRHRDHTPTPENNPIVRFARRRLPIGEPDGHRAITRRDGRWRLTPLFLVLVALGATDALFALDSIPAVYGVTQHPYIVFAANAFALLGLRALFFLVSGLLERLVYLSIGMAAILAFIGAKLVLEFLHHENHAIPEIGTVASLGVIAALLVITTVASLIASRGPGGRGRGRRSTPDAGPGRSQASMSPRRMA